MTGHRRTLRGGLAALAAIIIGTATVTPVFAAVPGNDDITSPTAISAIPYADGPHDTTEATAGAGDPTFCYGGNAGDSATVWYSYTAAESGPLVADTFGSDYDTTLYVGTADGTGGISVIDCNDDAFDVSSRVVWTAEAGTTYLFVVGTCCGGAGEGGGGGQLVFHLDVPPPPPTIDVTVNARGSFRRDGTAVIRGTLTCAGMQSAWIDVYVGQRVGRVVIGGSGGTLVDCTGAPEAWSADVYGNGRFAGGRAQVAADAYGCGPIECADSHVSRNVRLRR